MVYVVTAVHNRYEITKKFVEQLCQQTMKEITLVLVDDGSTDGTAQMVLSKMGNAVILHGDGNLWWGGGLHMAYRWFKETAHVADNDIVMISNDDVTFDTNYIEKAISYLKDNTKILLTGYGISLQTGKQVDGAVDLRFPEGGGHLIEKDEAFGNCATTHSLFMRVKDMKEIGGFHPVLLPHYGSDYEWTYRAHKKGYKIVCIKNLNYFVNEETTGIKNRNMKTIFSKRSVSNPIYKISFAIITPRFTSKIPSVITQITRLFVRIREAKMK